ncbi:MAG: SPFH domain-containing protein [Faecalicatena sp.]|uniref:SPFH domain-containing protein n=1 Tax=Faecalicatena sp. TaxID=2005360 RepID=UPI00258D6A46|nr:SPFH domain-containing protein [Faecalicatena sp.]MCI6464172.1 SPFH domain-containing protein [Faecalicatena sp.]MDY5621138.1 SPFH domain-containing protein [Lachnospiraceae bacterium]
MGLLKAGVGAATGVLEDQWREYFYCESMEDGVIASKGRKRTSRRSSNKRGEENIISNGAIIAVNEGQCMIIVDQGEIVAFSSEPGEFVWDNSTEPTIFRGGFEEGVAEAFETFKKRFTFGGDTGKDQRIYFFNTKELMGNKYGTPHPVPFRVIDQNIGLDMDIAIRCFGEYSYRLSNPILFYKNVCGNVETEFSTSELDSQLKSELLNALQPAFARISDMGIRYSSLPGHTMELTDALKEILSDKWNGTRGIEIVSIAISSIRASEKDEEYIKELQRSAVFRNPTMAAAYLSGAQGAAMQSAAKNENAGASMAFMGMGMAGNMGGMNAQNLYQMGQQQQNSQHMESAGQPSMAGQPIASGWDCSCGATGNTGKFCTECGAPRPIPAEGWSCSCGTVNKGKFCTECGAKKPAGVPQYRCDKCGWEPKDMTNPPKFCPECGDPFDDGDII